MSDPRVVTAGELAVDELLGLLEREGRVVVRTAFLGAEHDVTLRWDGETYYCDTPTRLHRHDSAAEMRTCLENQGYGQ